LDSFLFPNNVQKGKKNYNITDFVVAIYAEQNARTLLSLNSRKKWKDSNE